MSAEFLVREKHFFVSSALFTDEARFGADGIRNIHNQHQWAERNPHGVIRSRYQKQFSINVWAVIIWYSGMFCHLSLKATTTEISSCMIYQSYWKMCH
jgi:hypothetical protein